MTDSSPSGAGRSLRFAVEFLTEDGVVLRGEIQGASERWVVLVHDQNADLDVWRPLVAHLLDLSLCPLAFDLRGHGASDDPWDPRRAVLDVETAIRFARGRGAEKIVVVGEGAGATAALVAAGRERVAGVVLLSPRAELDGGEPDAIRDYRGPKLLIAGGGGAAAVAAAQPVQRRSIGWTSLLTPPVDEQGAALLRSAWADHAREAIESFLRDYLPPATNDRGSVAPTT